MRKSRSNDKYEKRWTINKNKVRGRRTKEDIEEERKRMYNTMKVQKTTRMERKG